jgi:HAD superfamily hydrolase (TIGR01450 family)
MTSLSFDDERRVTSPAPLTAPAPLAATELAGWSRARHVLLDLDGTLIHQRVATPGAAALLRRLEGRCMVVSNNSTDTAAGLARRLRAIGLPVTPRQLVLAGEQMLNWLAEHHPHARIRLAGSAAIAHHAHHRGLQLVDARPDFVVLARDERFTYAKLTAMANDLLRGARLVVANGDLQHPALDGGVVPETGALLQAVRGCSGVAPYYLGGKPQSPLFREALRRLGADPAETLMIGDNPATDARGAARLGMRCLLLGEGPGAHAASPAALLAQD